MAPLNSDSGAFTPMACAMGSVASSMRPLASTTFTPAFMARRSARMFSSGSTLLPASSVPSRSVTIIRIIFNYSSRGDRLRAAAHTHLL